ncbi:MAG: DUF4129 domain-containing protein [Acidimicrobiales bacterium]
MRGLARWAREPDLSGRAGAAPRLALLVLLTLLVAVGLHGKVSSPSWGNRSKPHDAEVVAALLVVCVVLALALAVRNRRAPPDQLLAARLRTALLYLLSAGISALVVTFVLLVVKIGPFQARAGRGPVPQTVVRPGRLPLPGTGGTSSHFPLSEILYALAAAVLVLATVAVALMIMRHGRHQPAAEPEAPAQEYGGALQEALIWGQRALLELDDARAAIIACYMAMEESLARAGAARASAETPDELLARAARTLLITAASASRLTSLFYEARFSTHPLYAAQRDAAERALAELVLELDHPRAVPTGATS